MADKLKVIKELTSGLSYDKYKYLDDKHIEWLVEQAETLQKITSRWIEIETNGTVEEAEDFYTFVQDTLTSEQLEDK